MKILMILPHPPFLLSSGGRVRSYNLLSQLAKETSVEIDLLCYIKKSELCSSELLQTVPCKTITTIVRKERPPRKELLRMTWVNSRCLLSQIHFSKEMRHAVEEYLSTNRYDLVYVVSFYMLSNIPEWIHAPLVLEELSIEHVGMRRHLRFETDMLLKLIYLIETFKQREEERRAWQRADVCVTVSEADAKSISDGVPKAIVHIVPNGVDTGYFCASDCECSIPTVLFVGNYRYYPNVDAAILLARTIFSLVKQEIKEAKLVLAGGDPPQGVRELSRLPGVTVTGYVPDHRALLGKAWVFAAPLRSGSGTRTKLLEAFSMQKPVVTTTIGAEGLQAENLTDLIIEDNPKRFAEWIVRLIQSKKLRLELGSNARSLVIQRYRWEESSMCLLSALRATASSQENL